MIFWSSSLLPYYIETIISLFYELNCLLDDKITMYRNHEETMFWINESSIPLDSSVVKRLKQAEWEKFVKRTEGSREEMEKACNVIPLGVTSSFQHWDPYPSMKITILFLCFNVVLLKSQSCLGMVHI